MAILGPCGNVSRLVFPMGMGENVRTGMALEAAGFETTEHVFLFKGEAQDDTFT